MPTHEQTVQIGNSPYIHAVQPGPIDGARLLPGDPADIAGIEKRYDELRDQMNAELRHDEEGIDTKRVASFLGKYGLTLQPFIAIPGDAVPQLESILGEHVTSEGQILGAHLPESKVTYIIRNKELEEGSTTGITEAILVHEQAHANKTVRTIAYGRDVNGDTFSMILRSGFKVEDGRDEGSGNYYEEAFAALMAHKYVVEELGKPNGFSDWGGVQNLMIGGQKLKMPRSYWFPTSKHDRFGGTDTPSFAAYGMELLIAKDPSIFDSMLKSRHSTKGLREFAHKIESLDRGLYRLLGRQPYQLEYFAAATNYIIETLYDGDQDKAIEVVSSPMPAMK